MYPFERFTEKAKRVLTMAQEEAEKAKHSYIGSEHLLLALLRQRDGVAATVLDNLGVDVARSDAGSKRWSGRRSESSSGRSFPPPG